MYGIVNTDKVKPEDRPKSLADSHAAMEGPVAISQPSRGGTDSAALMAVADAIGPDFAHAGQRTCDILMTRGNEAAISAVISASGR